MKKIFYYLCFLLLLFLINMIPTSAKEIKTCVRTESNLRVRDRFLEKDNLNDILTTPCVDEMQKVYDFADLLTDDEETKLYDEVTSYIKKNDFDLALVIIDDNPKYNAKTYADDFYNYNNFGVGESRDGSLILIDMDTREFYISTAGYAIKMYDDYRIEEVLDVGEEYVINEKYYDAFSNMIISLDEYVELDYPESNKDLIILENGDPYYIKRLPYGMIFLIALIITIIVSVVLYNMSRLKIKVISSANYISDEGNLVKNDHLVNTIVTHTPRANNNNHGGGSHRSGSGGGSSFHRSSGGSFNGGGGRRF